MTNTASATVKLLNPHEGDELLFVATTDIEGTVTAGPDGSMLLTLTPVAGQAPTNADFEAALKTVKFNNTSDNPHTTVRTVQFQVSNGVRTSKAVTENVEVAAVNDAPITSDAAVTTEEDVAYTFKLSDFAFTDADIGDALKEIEISEPEAGTLKLNGTPLHFTNGTIIVQTADIAVLTFEPTADTNGVGYATIAFSVIDQSGAKSAPHIITVDVTAIDDAPTDITLSANSMVENAAAGTVIATLSSIDPDVDNTGFTYSLVDGDGINDADNHLVDIVGNQLVIKSGAVIDFESNPNLAIYVQVIDDDGLNFKKALTVNVSDENEAPTAVALTQATASLAENTAIVDRLEVGSYAITDDALGTNDVILTGTDAGHFEAIDGKLHLKAGTTLNHEAQSSYAVTVNVADQTLHGSTPVTADFTLTVTDVNEAPTAVVLSQATTSLAENTAIVDRLEVGSFSIADDALGAREVTLAGADAHNFEAIDGKLYLKAGTTLDYETKSSYAVTVNVADPMLPGSTPATADFALAVTNVNEAPTDITLSANSVAENTAPGAVIATLSAIDPDAGDSTFTYGLVGGNGTNDADNDLIDIVGDQIRVAPGAVIDFETKQSLAIYVQARDAHGNTLERALTLSVSDVAEAPTDITLSTNSVAENTAPGTVIATLSAIDPDAGDTSFTYGLVGGDGINDADNHLVDITGNQIKRKRLPSTVLTAWR